MIGNELHLGQLLMEAAGSDGTAEVFDPLYDESGSVSGFVIDDELGAVLACVGADTVDGDVSLQDMLDDPESLAGRRAYLVYASELGKREFRKAMPVARALVGDGGQLLLIV